MVSFISKQLKALVVNNPNADPPGYGEVLATAEGAGRRDGQTAIHCGTNIHSFTLVDINNRCITTKRRSADAINGLSTPLFGRGNRVGDSSHWLTGAALD